MSLRLLHTYRRSRGATVLCQCSCGKKIVLPASQFQSGHKKTCGQKLCTAKQLSKSRIGKPRPDLKGKTPANKLDRTGKRYGKLIAIKESTNNRWECLCDCGNVFTVLSTNLADMAKNNRGCRHCANRQDIHGEHVGLLTAESVETGPISGRHPLWTFRCTCGNTITGTVREFRAGYLRSCGCYDNAHASWACMMARCYNRSNNRYSSYGGRGIKVCRRWHTFENFIADMGERPKRHTLGRKHAEKDYCPSNCVWEHISKNGRDTDNAGNPTKPGRLKGARKRHKE